MDTRTGKIFNLENPEDMEDIGKEDLQHLIPVRRTLTNVEKAKKQIKLYSPCVCGSGKKFKFCCRKVGES